VLLYNLKEDLPEEEYLLPLDRAEVVRAGQDVTILTYSRMRHQVLRALEGMLELEIDPEIIDLISLKPLDMATISESVRKTHRVVIVEEDMKSGGIGAEITARIMEELFDELDAPVVRLASQDIPTPYNGVLEAATIVQPADIITAVSQLVS
ncbi:MAG: transketolase C-terminal domain-containing protein, partial [Thermostichales cyanobacterium BF4_bins_65]